MRRRDCKRRCSPDRNVAPLIACPVGHEKLHLIEKDKKTQKPYSIRERLRRGLSVGLRIRLRATVKQTRHNFFYRLTRSCIVTIRGVSEEKKKKDILLKIVWQGGVTSDFYSERQLLGLTVFRQ